MSDLAQSVLISRSGLTRLVDRMEDAGLVRRERSPADKRGSEAVLTDHGRARLRKTAPTHLRGIEQHFSRHLTPQEMKTMAGAFAKIIAASSRADQADRSRAEL
jgi:DNA-binding MarR family transcriptional regulator